MAEPPIPTPEGGANYQEQGEQLGAGLGKSGFLEKLATALAKAYETAMVKTFGFLLEQLGHAAAYFAELLVKSEARAEPAFAKLAAVAIKDIFGIQVSEGDVALVAGRQGRANVAPKVAEMILNAVAGGKALGDKTPLVPSAEGAKNYVETMALMSLESWLQGLIFECVTAGQVEALGELDDTIVQALGLGRIRRRVL